jgi:hypothetical protein
LILRSTGEEKVGKRKRETIMMEEGKESWK